MAGARLLLVHHFPLSEITGVTVMASELLRLIPEIDNGIQVWYEDFGDIDRPETLTTRIRSRDPSCVVGINLHIEVRPELSLALAHWCAQHNVPLYNYVQDYWAHHFAPLRQLTDKFQVRLLAPSFFIEKQLLGEGFRSAPLPMGAQLSPNVSRPSPAKVIGSIGRMVRRKRFPDIVRAFCFARLDETAQLRLTLLPSRVFGKENDAEQLLLIRHEREKAGPNRYSIHLSMTPMSPPDYSSLSIYVSASDYEGFGMTPYEAAYAGCPPILSDIPPHRHMAESIFGDHAEDFLYPAGNIEALADRLLDETKFGHRWNYLLQHHGQIRKIIEGRYSLRVTAEALARICRDGNSEPPPPHSHSSMTNTLK